MVAQHELRKGNLVYAGEDEAGPFPCKILQLLEKVAHWTSDMEQDSIGAGYSSTIYEYIEPIPLTPAILEAVGFVLTSYESELPRVIRNDREDSYNAFRKYTYYHYVCSGFVVSEKPPFYHGTIELKSLHQLQNLFFALKQTELKNNLGKHDARK
jgi:hypothetical protein